VVSADKSELKKFAVGCKEPIRRCVSTSAATPDKRLRAQDHQLPRDTHSKAAREQLVEEKSLPLSECQPGSTNDPMSFLVRGFCQWQQTFLHPESQRLRSRTGGNREQQCERFGQIPDEFAAGFPAAIPGVRRGPHTTVAAVAPSQHAAACCHTRTKLPTLHPQDPQNGNTAPAPRCGRWSVWNCRALRRVLRSAAWGAGAERWQGSWNRSVWAPGVGLPHPMLCQRNHHAKPDQNLLGSFEHTPATSTPGSTQLRRQISPKRRIVECCYGEHPVVAAVLNNSSGSGCSDIDDCPAHSS
jgi:hypothetical protein